MAVVGHLHKVVWGGSLFGTETWSCSVHFLSADAGELATDLFESALSEWFLRATSKINSWAKLEWLKINEIVPGTGLYLNGGNPRTLFYTPAIDGAGGTGIPNNTLACSTVTALARGRSSKGRFFPPNGGLEATISDGGKTPAATALAVSVSAAQLLTDFNGAASGSCVVFSKIGQLTQEIVAVKVGRIVDNQSRRRRNLLEDYQLTLIS